MGNQTPPISSPPRPQPNPAPQETWQSRVYNAPPIGGPGSSPILPSFHGVTPSNDPLPIPESSSSGVGRGISSPSDKAPAGRSPHILDRIPEQPPLIRHGAQPIPTNVSGGKAMPITQRHIDHLMQNPHLAPQFDQKFGSGASAQFLWT